MIDSTRVALSWEWTSLTRVSAGSSEIADAYGDRTGNGRATQAAAGRAARAADDALKKSRRFSRGHRVTSWLLPAAEQAASPPPDEPRAGRWPGISVPDS